MPEGFVLKTEISSNSKVLLVDEIGGFVSSLVDLLLARQFEVYYCGAEPLKTFDYLSGKKTFHYLDSPAEEIREEVEYVYFFPKENLEKIRLFFLLVQKFSCRLLVCAEKTFPQIDDLVELMDSKEINIRLVLFGEVYGPRVVDGDLARYFFTAQKKELVNIKKAPEDAFTAIYSGTLLQEILRVSFNPTSKGKIVLIRPEEITYLDFVNILKKLYPGVDFVFGEAVAGRTEEQRKLPEKTKDVVVRENFESRAEETAEWFYRVPAMSGVLSENQESSSKQPPKLSTEVVQEVIIPALAIPKEEEISTGDLKKKKVFKKSALAVLIFLLFLFSFFVLPMAAAIGFGIKGITTLHSVKVGLEGGDFDRVLTANEQAMGYLNISKKTISTIEPFYSLIGFEGRIKSISEAILFSVQAGESIKAVLNSFGKISFASSSFLKGEAVDWEETRRAVKTDFSFAYQQASLAQSSLKEAEKGFTLLQKSDFFATVRDYLQDYRGKLLKGQKLALLIPEIMGVGGRKTYVVLIQNNLELRPTGGFISGFAIASVENGKLTNFEVHDVYQADSGLKGQVEPPAKIKEILGEQVWYLRDANFDPEFSSSAGRILWFLDKEMHISADGVIALTLNTLRDVLAVTGEVEMPDYGEKIDKSNLFQKTFQYSEVNLEGTKKREEFLVHLTSVLFEKLKLLQKDRIIGVEGAIFSSLENKETLVYMVDPKIEEIVTELGWNGGLGSFKQPAEIYSVFTDYLMINEANFGINKANYFTRRKTNHEIKIGEEGSVEEKLTLVFENQSQSENWPAGNYKNYLRIYLHRGSEIVSVSATDPDNPESLPGLLDSSSWEVFEEHDRTVFGLLLDVPVRTKVTFEMAYRLKEKIDFSKKINSYLILVQKQPGSYSSDYHLTVFLPPNSVPLRVIPKAVAEERKLTIEESLTKDRIFQVDIARGI